MNTHIRNAEKFLKENNAIGMSSSGQPIQWNLHNAIAALIKGFEEENERLSERVSRLEKQLHKK